MVETPTYFSGLPWFCCYFMGATVGVCSTTELPAEDFQSEPFIEGDTALERTPVCLVWKCLILSVPCVQWLSACGQEGYSSGSHRRKYAGENGLVWEWVGLGVKFSLRKWSAACENRRTTNVAHSGSKTNKCKGRCAPGSYSSVHGKTLKCAPAPSSGLFISECGQLAFLFSLSLQAGDPQFCPSGNVPWEHRERT